MTLAHEGYSDITSCSSCNKEFKFRDLGVEYNNENTLVFCEKCAREIARIIIQDLIASKTEASFLFFEEASKKIDFKRMLALTNS